MIVVTRLNGTQFAINPDLLERVEAVPDTALVLVGNTRYIVTESMSQIIEMVTDYRAHVIARAGGMSSPGRPGGPVLSAVPSGTSADPVPLRPRSSSWTSQP